MPRTERRKIEEGYSLVFFLIGCLFVAAFFRYQFLLVQKANFQSFLGQIVFQDGTKLTQEEAMGFYFSPEDGTPEWRSGLIPLSTFLLISFMINIWISLNVGIQS